MARKIDVTKIDLQIDEIKTYEDGMSIYWSSTIGFGEYSLYRDGEKLCGYSECMDAQDDKAFLAEVLRKASEYIIENINITG